jgi:hypothetical protein
MTPVSGMRLSRATECKGCEIRYSPLESPRFDPGGVMWQGAFLPFIDHSVVHMPSPA